MRWRPPVPGQKVGPFPSTRPADAADPAPSPGDVEPAHDTEGTAAPDADRPAPLTSPAQTAEPDESTIESAAGPSDAGTESAVDDQNTAPDAAPETSER